MFSTLIPVLTVCAAILVSYKFAGLYGIAISAVGMLSTLGITLAANCYSSVADNAAGIAESLDAVGNTTAAMGKGFAIGSAALTALALFASYTEVAAQLIKKPIVISITNPNVIVGLFIGALIPFIFSALALKAVGIAAQKVVNEVK